jgi:hypothetical protein
MTKSSARHRGVHPIIIGRKGPKFFEVALKNFWGIPVPQRRLIFRIRPATPVSVGRWTTLEAGVPEPAWATVARVAPQGLAGEVFVGIRIHGAGDRRGGLTLPVARPTAKIVKIVHARSEDLLTKLCAAFIVRCSNQYPYVGLSLRSWTSV